MNIDKLNKFYKELEQTKKTLVAALNKLFEEVEVGYYNGHYHKNSRNVYIMDYYPIPVISILGLCDIEINPDKISVTTKLSKANALGFNYDKLDNMEFEIYGVKNYLNDFYSVGYSIEQLKNNISNTDEDEIAFSFYFPKGASTDTIRDFIVDILKSGPFYY